MRRSNIDHDLGDAIFRLCRNQLISLLRIIKLEQNGNMLPVEGLRVRTSDFDRVYDGEKAVKGHESPNGCLDSREICRFEPRLEFIRRQVLSILRLTEVIANGVSIEPDAFRLVNPQHWVSGPEMDGRHGDPYYDILKYLSWPCGNDCWFCLHKGDPPGFSSKSRMGWRTSEGEIVSRLKHWRPSKNFALFSKHDLNHFEIVSHPDFFSVARGVRKKSKRLITIVTSGADLTRTMVESLDSLRPLLVIVSLNSSSATDRSHIMEDLAPNVAIQSLLHLNRRKIPFIVSLTVVPNLSAADFEKSIRFADGFSPYLVRLNLGAFTKHHPNRKWKPGGALESWLKAVKSIRALRETIPTPMIVQPAMFEECFFEEEPGMPVLEGTVLNSPAFFAGIRAGDKIVSIGGTEVLSNRFARHLLRFFALREVEQFEVDLNRGATTYKVAIDVNHSSYPYVQYRKESPSFYPFGLVLRDSLDPLEVNQIKELALDNRAESILVLSSVLVKPALMKQLQDLGIGQEDGLSVSVEVPQNTHFLGGDTILGDLLVVDDFVDSIRRWIGTHRVYPDLAIIPSTPFSRWGRDLQGKNREVISRLTGVPVAFLDNQEILALG